MNYIISLKHTAKEDPFLTLWRPNDRGYCYPLESAGEYDHPQKGYHDNESNMPITKENAEKLALNTEEGKKIPNVTAIHQILKVKAEKRNLKRIES